MTRKESIERREFVSINNSNDRVERGKKTLARMDSCAFIQTKSLKKF